MMKMQAPTALPFAITIMFVLACSPALALEDSPLSFGPKIGLNITDFSGDDLPLAGELLDWKLGFCGGAFLAYAVNDWFTVQTELLYSMKGMKLGIFDDSMGFSLDYIEIPVLAMLTVPTNSRFTPIFFVGPSIGFNVRADFFEDDEEPLDVKDLVKFYEVGLVFGGGTKIKVCSGELVIEARYVLSFTSIFDGSDVYDADVKNDVISIMLGYGF